MRYQLRFSIEREKHFELKFDKFIHLRFEFMSARVVWLLF